jgi:putative ABC transport system permease protein
MTKWIPDRYRELRDLLGGDRLRDDVDEELIAHLEQRVADLIASGMSEVSARQEAMRRFGDLARYRRETLLIDESMVKEQRRMEWFDAVRRETKHAARALWRAPAFTFVAVLTLGLGIGGTTAIFTLVDSIVLRPLPYADPDQVVQVRHAVPNINAEQKWSNSVASYYYYVDHNRSFSSVGAYGGATINLSGDGEAERVDAAVVSASLLETIGARTIQGRLFTAEEDQPGAEPVALLSYDLWLARYGGDRSVVGRAIEMNSRPVTVLGVLAPDVKLPNLRPAIWRPALLDRAAQPVNYHWVNTIARMRPGVTTEVARADLQRLTDELPAQFPGAYSDGFMKTTGFRMDVTSLRADMLGSIEQVLWVLLGAVALVLLIACANVANLLLVRAEARRRELTVRAALGAERAHLAVHYVTESVLLALIAGALGVLLAYAGVQLLLSIAPATLPRLDEVALRWRVVAFAFATALCTGLLFGTVPLLRSRTDFTELRDGGRGLTASRKRHFVRGTLVVAQVAMALVLLAAGALLLRSFLNLRRVQSGIVAENVLTLRAFVPPARYGNAAAVHTFQRELIDGLAALPGVTAVSGINALPLSDNSPCSYTTWEGMQLPAGERPPCLPIVHVLPDFFTALGIPVRGRTFDWNDVERRAGDVVVSRAVAERLWPGQDPIGKGIRSYGDGPPWYRVIGVAADVRARGLDEPPVETIYYPTLAMEGTGQVGPHSFLTYVVKTATSHPERLTNTIRQIVAEMDRAVPVSDVKTMTEVVNASPSMARRSFSMVLLGIAAGMALFLSAVGLYGVIAYVVGQRRGEIGIRMAMGARVGQVGRLVVLQSLRLAALGVGLGVLAALAFTRALTSLLFEVDPADPLTIVAVSALLLLVATLASLVPAWRAARTDPVEALRS